MRPLQGQRIGIVGCGNMGSAIASALVASGEVEPENLWLLDRLAAQREAVADATGGQIATGPTALTEAVDIVLIALKPKDVLPFIASVSWPERSLLIVSVAAGLRVATIQEAVPSHNRVIRAMPNTPALVRAGIAAVLKLAEEPWFARAAAIFATCGEVVVLREESHFDVVTALSGSGPAYAFVAAEAMADGGVKMGLPRAVAQKLALHTIRGAAELAIQTGRHPADLKDAVASPGGTTIHGLSALEDGGFRAALINAVEAATMRSRDLGGDKKG